MTSGSLAVLIFAIATAIYTFVVSSNPSSEDYDENKKKIGFVVTLILWIVFALMQAFPGIVGTAYN